jgi:prevent-host-death family protein
MYTKLRHCGTESWAVRLALISQHATVTFEKRHLDSRALRPLTSSNDHGTLRESLNMSRKSRVAGKNGRSMHEIAISKFKAKCLSLLEEVNKTKMPLRVTRRGIPLADVVPASPDAEKRAWIGSMTGTLKITGDIVSPVIDLGDIEALRK